MLRVEWQIIFSLPAQPQSSESWWGWVRCGCCWRSGRQSSRRQFMTENFLTENEKLPPDFYCIQYTERYDVHWWLNFNFIELCGTWGRKPLIRAWFCGINAFWELAPVTLPFHPSKRKSITNSPSFLLRTNGPLHHDIRLLVFRVFQEPVFRTNDSKRDPMQVHHTIVVLHEVYHVNLMTL